MEDESGVLELLLLSTVKTSLGFWNSDYCSLDFTVGIVLQKAKAVYYKRKNTESYAKLTYPSSRLAGRFRYVLDSPSGYSVLWLLRLHTL